VTETLTGKRELGNYGIQDDPAKELNLNKLPISRYSKSKQYWTIIMH